MSKQLNSIQSTEDELIGENKDEIDLWKREPHTEAKHKILDGYLKAWFPILGSSNRRIIYLDGFAGPGEYEDGEAGSPIIAIKIAKNHALSGHRILKNTDIIFYFIDKNRSYCKNLEQKIRKMEMPSSFNWHVECAKFDQHLTSVLDQLENENSIIAPTFAFIDPFGYSDTPLSVISRFMKNPKCEVFINFMVGPINRWATDSNKAVALDNLFGTNSWKDLIEIDDSFDRIEAYADLYEYQLKNVANIRYIRRFLMTNRYNQPLYFLFFCTNNKLGLRAMKRAMWNINLSEGNVFWDRTDPHQTVLFKPEPDYEPLESALFAKFRGGKVPIMLIEDFVLTETPYMPDRHLKKPVLVPLEDKGRIIVHPIDSSKIRRKHSYKNCYVEFN
jgi:three-Cys-motif partner protein